MPRHSFVDETGRIDPMHPPDIGEAHRAKVRADYGLPAPKPRDLHGAWQIADAASAAAEEAAGGQGRLDEALREINDDRPLLANNTDQDEGRVPHTIGTEDNETETARFLNDLLDETGVELSDDELTELWKSKRYTHLSDAFEDARKLVTKKIKRASISEGAAASTGGRTISTPSKEAAAAELDKIQRGPEPSSPKHRARRAELRKILRGF